MLTPIPAIDIIDGKCVRLTKGDYATQKVYNEDPVAVAKEVEQYGLKRLHVVDLDGARSKHVVNYKVLERMAAATNLVIDFGGGIKTDEDLYVAFSSGASMATIGSVAVTNATRFLDWLQRYGAECLILGADVKDGLVSINGWKEDSEQTLLPFLDKYLKAGVQHVLCTDISRDGMLQGPATELYRDVMQTYPDCRLIASGGVSSKKDLEELDAAGVPAAVIGKALFEGRITMEDLVC